VNYELGNFIVNIFTAVGTCGAVGTALWLSRPKKEKAEGYFKISFLEYQDRAVVVFLISNVGNKNIKIDCKIGACLKSNDIQEYGRIDPNYNDIYIPKKVKRYYTIFINFRSGNVAKKIYENKNSIFCLYTSEGVEIELTKNENIAVAV